MAQRGKQMAHGEKKYRLSSGIQKGNFAVGSPRVLHRDKDIAPSGVEIASAHGLHNEICMHMSLGKAP